MNYRKIYNDLCNRGQVRVLETYTEKHHIIPRCIGGSDSNLNLTKLTAKEHYIAHLLLTRIYPNNSKLLHAFGMMAMIGKDNKRFYTATQYAKMSDAKSTAMKLSNPSKKGVWNKGMHVSHRKTPIADWERAAAVTRMTQNNPNATGDLNKKITYVTSIDGSESFKFNSLKESEEFMSKHTGKIINHASVYHNMKKNKPYKGYIWTYNNLKEKK